MVEEQIVRPVVEDNPSTTDKLSEDNMEEMVKKYQLEIENMEKNIVMATELKAMDSARFDIEKKLWALHLEGDNIELVNPTNKLHAQPRYWELQKELLALDYALQEKDREETIKSHDQGIKNMKKNIESIQSKLKDMGIDNE